MSEDWRELFEPGPVPPWLEAFEADPAEAVDALMRHRFHHGPFQAAEPQDLLSDWTRDLRPPFAENLDRELCAWVERNWNGFPEDIPAALLADAWSIVADVVAWTDPLQRTAQALRQRFSEASEYLGMLSTSSSRDPLGSFYGAVAAHQEDRSLAPFWWRLAGLPEGAPDYHGRYALEGMRGLPAPEGELETGYRPEAVQALGHLARGLKRRADADTGSSSRYLRRFLALGRLHLRSLGHESRWKKDLGRALSSRRDGDPDWLLKLVPNLRPSAIEEPPESWRDRLPQIHGGLRRRDASTLEAAERLLDEQRRYAQTTGEADEFLVRTLCSFSKAVWSWRADQAVTWSQEALLWAPWNATAWNTLSKSLLYAHRPTAAVEVGWQAVERFPQNDITRNTLADALKDAGRPASAVAVYRETLRLFPEVVVARAGLGETLKAQGKLEDAESVYRETVQLFPDNAVARNGLGETLRAQGELNKAESVYRETVRLFPHDVVARAGLAGVLVNKGELDEAEALYHQVLDMNPGNGVAKTGLRTVERLRTASEVVQAPLPYRSAPTPEPSAVPDAGEVRIWRRQARRSEGEDADRLRREAEQMADEILEQHPHEDRALAEKIHLALDRSQLDHARELLNGRASHLPASAPLLATFSRLNRQEAHAKSLALAEDSQEKVLHGSRRLLNLDGTAYAPVVHLQEGRALLALEGPQRLELTARRLEKLRAWTAAQPKGTKDFVGWWAERAADHALDGKALAPKIEADDVPELETWQLERTAELDALEEDFCLRQAALRSEPRLPELIDSDVILFQKPQSGSPPKD